MQKILLFTLFLFGFNVALVQAAYITQQESTFDIPTLKSVTSETIYGNLSGFPHTFTFAVSEETPFSMQVSMYAGDETKDVSLILIKQEKRGVSEVGRVSGKDVLWSAEYDIWRAISFAYAPKQSYTLQPGTYRLEVSSPENNRAYRLLLGDGDSSLPKEIFTVRKVFAVSPWSALLSPFVFGFIALTLGLLYYRKKKKYVS